MHPIHRSVAILSLSTALCASEARTIAVTLDQHGFSPTAISAVPGQVVVIAFTTERDQADIVWPATGITHRFGKDHPLRVVLKPDAGQRIAFASGDAKGEVVAEDAAPAAVIVDITVDQAGFHPDRIPLALGKSTTLRFKRVAEFTCNDAVKIPDLGVMPPRTLPLNEAVDIVVKPEKAGEFVFSCPMNMGKGKLIVSEAGDAR